MKIAAFEGFYGGSHRKWLDGFARHSAHDVEIFYLPDRFWKWRMHGGAITLAKQFNDSECMPDCLLVTDMIDLNVLLSLTRKRTAGIPVIFYFHENQINYPWSEIDRDVKYQRDHHYGFINYASALAADIVLFNSQYHKDAFIGALPRFLNMFPEFQNTSTIAEIANKSTVLPLGIDFRVFDASKAESGREKVGGPSLKQSAQEDGAASGGIPVILWNHRWEFDKNPEVFFDVMLNLHKTGLDFRLIICGERTEMYPSVFDDIKGSLSDHIVHWGYVENIKQYADVLCRSDIMPVTSNQDFFGISAVEAMYCGVYPLLPQRLAFPGHVPDEYKDEHLYSSQEDLEARLKKLLIGGIPKRNTEQWVAQYDWKKMIAEYDAVFEP